MPEPEIHSAEERPARKQPLPLRAVAAAGSAAMLLATVLYLVFPEVHSAVDDLLLLLRSRRPLDSRIVLMDLERWPRDRLDVARAIELLGPHGPAVIGLDVLLDEPKVREPEHDAAMVRALARAVPVVLAAALELVREGREAVPLLGSMSAAASATGFANFYTDPDQRVRRLPHLLDSRLEPSPRPEAVHLSFALALAQAYFQTRGLQAPELVRDPPTDHRIDWSEVRKDWVPLLGADRWLEDAAHRAELLRSGYLRDKIVLIGYLGVRFKGDGFMTPQSTGPADRAPGPVVHANIVDNLLNGRRLVDVPVPLMLALAAGAGFSGAFAGRSGLTRRAAAIAAIVLLAPGIAELWALESGGWVLPGLPLGAAGVSGLLFATSLTSPSVQSLRIIRPLFSLFGQETGMEVAILDITSEERGGVYQYDYRLREQGGAGARLSRYLNEVDDVARWEVFDELSSFIGRSDGVTPVEVLTDVGDQIARELMPDELVERLRTLAARSLHLEISGHDLGIPWELALIDGKPLALRFKVSRALVVEDTELQPLEPQPRDGGLRALLVGSPLPPERVVAFEDLPGPGGPRSARSPVEEAELVAAELESLARGPGPVLHLEKLTGERATLRNVSERLASGEIDLFHYCGHWSTREETGGEPGFYFPDGVLSADRLRGMSLEGGLPPVVFANACWTGGASLGREALRSRGRRAIEENLTLPSAFVGAGVRLFVGCLWRVESSSAARFALAFYGRLKDGDTAGDALAGARPAADDEWMTHLAYVMYGNPGLRLARGAGQIPEGRYEEERS